MAIIIISWALQIFLALFFLKPAITNLTLSPEKLIEKHMLQPGKAPTFNRFLGTSQALGIIGIIFPKLLDTLPILTAFAGLGFALMMAGAIFIHSKDGHTRMIPMLAGVLAAGVAVFLLNL